MNKNYLAIISRFEFNDLYKFGHIHITNSIEFDGIVKEDSLNEDLFCSLTSHTNTIENTSDYLVLHILSDVSEKIDDIHISQVVAIYALDDEAKARLSASFDPRINLEISPWASYFTALCVKQAVEQALIGINNCFCIFDIPHEDEKTIKTIVTEAVISDIFETFYAKKRPSGKRTIWEYLVRYERHSPYWNCIKGFFSDAIHVFENYLAEQEIDDDIADQVEIGMVINDCGTNDSFKEIYDKLMQNKTERYSIEGCNYLAAAALYLYMRSLFSSMGISKYSNLEETNRV